MVNLQHDILDALPTRVVAPVLPRERAGQPVRDAMPTVWLASGPHLVATHQVATVPTHSLGRAVGSLDAEADALMRAVGILMLTGV